MNAASPAKRQYKPRIKQYVAFADALTARQLAFRLQRGTLKHTELGLERKCPICGEFWPYDNDFFYSYKSACIDCFQQRKANAKKNS